MLIVPEVFSPREHRGSTGTVTLLRGRAYHPQQAPPTWKQMQEVNLARMNALLSTCPSADAISHEAAALLHGAATKLSEPDIRVVQARKPAWTRRALPRVTYGLDVVTPDPPGRNRPVGRGGAVFTGRDVQARRYHRTDSGRRVVLIAGLPVTDLRTTIVDCLLDLPPLQSLITCDSLARILTDPQRFDPASALARWEQEKELIAEHLATLSPRHWSRRALRVLDLVTPLSESPGESEVRFHLLAAGLPDLVPQHPVPAGGRIYFLDLAVGGSRVAIEFDGRVKYKDNDVLYAEKQRQDDLMRLGWSIVRVRTEELREPRQVVCRVLEALRNDPHAEPALRLRARPWLRER